MGRFDELIKNREREIEQHRKESAADEKNQLEATWHGFLGVLVGAFGGFIAYFPVIIIFQLGFDNDDEGTAKLIMTLVIIAGSIVGAILFYNSKRNK